MGSVGTDVGSFGAKSVGPASCWSTVQDRGGGGLLGTVEGGGSRAVAQWTSGHSSSVDGPEGGRRPVAPSYRALQAELPSSTSRRNTDTREKELKSLQRETSI